jgi:hypothetical protein
MGFEFIRAYSGRRLAQYTPQPPLDGELTDDDESSVGDEVALDYEQSPATWQAMDVLDMTWQPQDWSERPVRFVDGKDVGETVAWLRAPRGYPVPIRLSLIGSVVMRVADGECRREFDEVERVVSMVTDVFPWYEVEAFAAELQANDLRLLTARAPDDKPSYDFETMRKAAQNKSNDEMGILEEIAIARDPEIPTIIDGRLEPRSGGWDDKAGCPVFGVVKKHSWNYLHPLGLQLVYQLGVGQRTPVFALLKQRRKGHEPGEPLKPRKLPVVSWYLRLSGGDGAIPNWGIVRVEMAYEWFEARGRDWDFVNRLSRTIYEYRSRERSYGRAAVSLHPIVRAEESLGALFDPITSLTQRFYRLTGL